MSRNLAVYNSCILILGLYEGLVKEWLTASKTAPSSLLADYACILSGFDAIKSKRRQAHSRLRSKPELGMEPRYGTIKHK